MGTSIFRFLILFAFGFAAEMVRSGEQPTNQWGPVTCGAQLSLILKKPIASNNPATTPKPKTNSLDVVVELRNVSDKVIATEDFVPKLDVMFSAVSPTGAKVKSKQPDPAEIVYVSGGETALRPGESLSVTIDLLDVFDFKESGTYKISAKRSVSRPDGNGGNIGCEVPSNELELKIPQKK